MRKITQLLLVLLITSLFTFALLNLAIINFNKEKHKIEYVVFYPNYNDTVIKSNIGGYKFYSYRGTNTISEKVGGRVVYEGTSPYKVLYDSISK